MKKSQIALMGLTAVIMLAVWFVKSPLNKAEEVSLTSGTLESTKVVALQEMRDVLSEQRFAEVERLDKIIASPETSLVEKNNAINEKQAISDLTELEVLMEYSVKSLGYTDAFVHKTNEGVEVLVIADSLSAEEVVDIMNIAYVNFDLDTCLVTYKPLSAYQS